MDSRPKSADNFGRNFERRGKIMPGWVIAAQWAARVVLLILVGLSVWSVAIMIDRRRALARGTGAFDKSEAERLIALRDWAALAAWLAPQEQLAARMLRAALELRGAGTAAGERAELAVRSFLSGQKLELERGLTVLATLGSNAPFIGLFGTVLGIIHAFAALGGSQEGVSSVMTGISEALLATAVGLLVAIPAVIAYNVFSRRIRVALSECEALKDFYLSRVDSSGPVVSGGL
jgi:biopolymer transport protein ExbB/TolQ